jgi:hypothetical protein
MLGTDLSGGQAVMEKPAQEEGRQAETAKQLISQIKRRNLAARPGIDKARCRANHPKCAH